MWWNSMSMLQQVMFIIACAASLIVVIQIILMLIGGACDNGGEIAGASDIDLDADFSGAGDIDLDAGVPGGVGDLPMDAFDEPSSIIGVRGGISDNDVADPTHAEVKNGGTLLPFGLKLLSIRSILAFIAVGGWVCYTLCYVLPVYAAALIAAVCGLLAAAGMAGALIGMERLQSSGNINPQNAVGKVGSVYLTIPPRRSGTGKVNVLVQERYCEYEAITDDADAISTGSEIKIVGKSGANVLIVTKCKKPSISVETVK